MAPFMNTSSLVLALLMAACSTLTTATQADYFDESICEERQCTETTIITDYGNGILKRQRADSLWAIVEAGSCDKFKTDQHGAEVMSRFVQKYNLTESWPKILERHTPVCDRLDEPDLFPCCVYPHHYLAPITCEALRESQSQIPKRDEELGVSVMFGTGCSHGYTIFFNETVTRENTAQQYKKLVQFLDEKGFSYNKKLANRAIYQEPENGAGSYINAFILLETTPDTFRTE